MALSKEKKAEVIDELSKLLADSKLTVFAKYQGTSVKSLQQLRKDARDNGTKVMVVKNRLIKKALADDVRFKDADMSALTGQLIYAFNAQDEVAPAQSLANFAKDEPQIEFVGGLMADGKQLAAEEVKTLSSLPSKNQIVAETVAMLLAPANDIVGGLSGSLPSLLEGIAAKAS
ncbi:MAG: 50S ribosomal protein L10 [Candidatus Saccharimonadales bacterium]